MDESKHVEGSTLIASANKPIGPVRLASQLILTINGGSSSLKYALFEKSNPSVQTLSGHIDRIGLPDARWILSRHDEGLLEDCSIDVPDQKAAVGLLINWLERAIGFDRIVAIGHRIVHGGNRYHRPERVSDELIEELRRISPCDPTHIPGEITLIEALKTHSPSIPQFACFDTSFHHDMPRVAQIVPIPRRFEADGVRRYGFHGLSYEFLIEELAKLASPQEARGRLILAHLGSGSSLAAVRNGCSIDTTMGFTPASGLVMGTRTGDFDPGLVRYLCHTAGMSVDEFDHLVNHKSGLLGVSGTTSDVKDLLARQVDDIRAAEAIELFCYQAQKGIGAFAAVLSGLDTLVFAGGVGENSPEIRRRICEGLGFLGVVLDDTRNDRSEVLISTDESRVKVRVIRTDEELMIAKSVFRKLGVTNNEES